MGIPSDPEPLLTPAEVAGMFRVDPKTVTKWAKAGLLSAVRTLGGHRRYRESEVKALLAGAAPSPRRVGLVDRHGMVVAVRNGQDIGKAWPTDVGGGWFARRVDRKSDAVLAFPSRDEALAWLRGGDPDEH